MFTCLCLHVAYIRGENIGLDIKITPGITHRLMSAVSHNDLPLPPPLHSACQRDIFKGYNPNIWQINLFSQLHRFGKLSKKTLKLDFGVVFGKPSRYFNVGHLRKTYEHIVQPEQAVVCSHSIHYRYPLFLLKGFFSCV